MPLRIIRDQRVRGERMFRKITREGKFAKGQWVHLWVFDEDASVRETPGKSLAKFGIVVSRKTDARAVKRNLWKRRIREILRRNQKELKAGKAIVVQSRSSGKVPEQNKLETEIISLLKKLEAI